MNSFLVAAKVVVPMAMMVGIGVILRLVSWTDAATMKKVDNLIFKLFMPCMSFYNLYNTDFSTFHNINYILFGVAVLMIEFLAAMFLVPKFVHPRPTAAAYGQALFRSNYLIFGAAVAESMYGAGNFGTLTLLSSVAVPIFNIQAAILLETARNGSADARKLLLTILKNPTVIATALGLAVNFSGLTLSPLVLDVVQDLSGLTTPLSFLSIGVSLSVGKVTKKAYLASCVALRLVIIPLIFVPIAAILGFRGQEMCSLAILFAAPTAVSSYPMAAAMGADGDFAAQMVAYTTILCLPTIFLWTLALTGMGLM